MDNSNNPLGHFTPAARLLIVSGVFLAIALLFVSIEWGQNRLPGGSYPLFYFAVPALLIAAGYVGVGFLLFRVFGVPAYREVPLTDEPTDPPTPEEDRTC